MLKRSATLSNRTRRLPRARLQAVLFYIRKERLLRNTPTQEEFFVQADGPGQITIFFTGVTPASDFTLYEGDQKIEIAPHGIRKVFLEGVYENGVFL